MFSAAYSESEPPVPIQDHAHIVSRRTGVSAECDQCDSPSQCSDSCGEVSEEAISALSKIFLFEGLGTDSLKQISGALQTSFAKAGEKIIQQGDEGDYLYILETGKVRYEIDGSKVGESGPGSCFGELALMYNAPRAATVIAVEDCKMWTLDRSSFKSIMLKSRVEKRKHSLAVLESINILKSLDQTSKSKLADALQPLEFNEGSVVIREGDRGDIFYMIAEGEADVTAGGKLLTTLKSGDYFGELALLDNTSVRAATVTAKTNLKLESLNKEGFERLLGPEVVEELKRRDPRKLSH